MKKKIFFLLFITLLIIPLAFADDVVLKTNRTEYYFPLNQEVIIPIEINNSYKDVTGLLSYTITQTINQQGSRHVNTNSQTTNFDMKKGEDIISLGLGKSNQEMQLEINLKYSYENEVIELNGIMVYFVAEQNKEEQSQSEPKESEKTSEEQDPQENQPKKPEKEDASTKMQNNQMNQDSNALKEQMKKDLAKEQKQEEEFKKNLAENKEFQEKHQEMLDKGYNVSDSKIDAENNETGDFEVNYEKDGKEAALKGNMQNNTMQELHEESNEKNELLEKQLRENEIFKEFNEELQKDGFNESQLKFEHQNNQTTAELEYKNELNETKTITATYEDDELKEVKLEREKKYIWFWTLFLLLGLFYVYKRFYKKKKINIENEEAPIDVFDFKKEAKTLLSKSQDLFDDKKYKDAYSKASQALRVYLAYSNNLNKETTCDNIIDFLKKHKKSYSKIKEAFDLCSLVDFAKYKANKEDFDEIITIAKKVIK